jgi:hypothetical protein
MKLPDWNSRQSVKSLEGLCFWTGIGFFFVCAVSGIFGSKSDVCNYVSGGAFIAGLLIEVISRACDTRGEALAQIADDEAIVQRRGEIENAEKRHNAELKELRAGLEDQMADELAETSGELERKQREAIKDLTRRIAHPHEDPYNRDD